MQAGDALRTEEETKSDSVIILSVFYGDDQNILNGNIK
jgi:hypothetical protein